MTAWISVDDRLPEKNQLVLVWLDGSLFHSGVAWKRHGYYLMPYHSLEQFSEWMYKAMNHLDADSLHVTHWMPLPEQPCPSP